MEDDNGLDLSLSLIGGKSTNFKVKNDTCSEGSSRLIHDFKNFLDGATQNEDRCQKSNQLKQEENLFYDLSSSNEELCNKRKNLFDETNNKKRHEKEAENEDVADSENVAGKNEINGNYLQEIRRFPNPASGMMTSPLVFGYSHVQMPILDSVSSLKPFEEQLSSNTRKITAGIAAEVKFGGNGSSPDLPWVSTTGSNGKTISGVTYKQNGSVSRVVCACHGAHMSVEEFVQHANNNPAASPHN